MESQPLRKSLARLRILGQLGEAAQLDGAEEGLGPPEAEAGLENALGGTLIGLKSLWCHLGWGSGCVLNLLHRLLSYLEGRLLILRGFAARQTRAFHATRHAMAGTF